MSFESNKDKSWQNSLIEGSISNQHSMREFALNKIASFGILKKYIK